MPVERFHSTFRLREIHDQHDLTDRLELHVVELPKQALATSGDEPVPWGQFFTDETDEALEAHAMTQPAIKKAVAALKEISADEKARQLALDRELAEATYRIEMGAAYHSGKDEGLAEGLQLAIRSTANALGLMLDPAREAQLDASDATQLRTLLDYLVRERQWPES